MLLPSIPHLTTDLKLWFEPNKSLDQRGNSPRNNNTGVRNPGGLTYATTIDKQGATPAATPTASKLNFIEQVLAGITSKMDGSTPFSTRRRDPSARARPSSRPPAPWARLVCSTTPTTTCT